MTELIIHVGYPKCATTLLQRRIFPNLRETVYHPSGDESAIYNALALKEFPGGQAARIGLIRQFEDQIQARPGRHLISVEHFVMPANCLQSRHPRVPRIQDSAQILDLIQEFSVPVRILMMFRHQPEWLRSWHQERIKRYETRNLRDYIRGTDSKPTLEAIRYIDTARALQHRFGADKVEFAPFELLRADRKHLQSVLEGLVGPIETLNFPIVRQGLRQDMLWLRQGINRALVGLARLTGGASSLDRGAQRLFKRILAYEGILPHMGPAKPPPVALPPDLAESYAACNAELARLTGFDLAALGYQVAPS